MRGPLQLAFRHRPTHVGAVSCDCGKNVEERASRPSASPALPALGPGSLVAPGGSPLPKEPKPMPQTAPQKNRQSMARPIAPQPVPDLEPAETADHEYALVSVLYHSLQGAQACEQY